MSIIDDLIISNSIKIRFQPIGALKNSSVIGFEALCYAERNEKYYTPDILFSIAKSEYKLLDLDRECRKEALRIFSEYENNEDMLLFLNFES